MGPFGRVEPQRVRDAVDDALRDADGVATLEAHVVLRGHAGQERDLLTAQPQDPATVTPVGRQACLLRGDLGSPRTEELADLGSHGLPRPRFVLGHPATVRARCTALGSLSVTPTSGTAAAATEVFP